MKNDRSSNFIPFSLGIVLFDKARDSDQIKVYPVEELPQINGKIVEFKKDLKVTTSNIKGETESAAVKGDAIIVASWVSQGNGNRNTSPDVIKNETVQIFRYADTDEYYWDTLFREPKLRRLETVCHMYGNLPKGMEPYTKASSYWMEVSTHDQHIQVHTTKSNEEPFEYDIKLNTATGELLIKDDIGNQIYLSSQAHQIKMINTDGSFYDMIAENITVNAPGTIKIIAGDSVNISAPLTTVDGDFTVTGTTTLQQGLNVSGGINSGGSISSGGSIRADGIVSGSNL